MKSDIVQPLVTQASGGLLSGASVGMCEGGARRKGNGILEPHTLAWAARL